MHRGEKMQKLIVPKKYDKKNLNNFILESFPNLNLNFLYKALRQKDIKINGKRVKENTDEKSFNAGKKAIYHSYTHLGASKYSKDHGNFLTYAYKADEIFGQSKLLVSDIRHQVKKHWYKIDSRLKN